MEQFINGKFDIASDSHKLHELIRDLAAQRGSPLPLCCPISSDYVISVMDTFVRANAKLSFMNTKAQTCYMDE